MPKLLPLFRAAAAALALQGGPGGAPSYVIFGAYFPRWLLAGLIGIVAALVAHRLFVAKAWNGKLPRNCPCAAPSAWSWPSCSGRWRRGDPMKLAGTRKTPALGRLIALAIIALGMAALAYAWHRSANYPATDSAGIDADLVHIATPVGGRLVGLPVRRTSASPRAMLLEIDPEPYRLTVQQAEADLAMARASLESRRRMLISERANSAIADEQLRRAEANHALAARTVKRLAPLAAQGYIPTQQYDQSQVTLRDAEVSLKQAQQQQAAAASTIGDEAEARPPCRPARPPWRAPATRWNKPWCAPPRRLRDRAVGADRRDRRAQPVPVHAGGVG